MDWTAKNWGRLYDLSINDNHQADQGNRVNAVDWQLFDVNQPGPGQTSKTYKEGQTITIITDFRMVSSSKSNAVN